MASTWIWYGNYDRLERIEYSERLVRDSDLRKAQSFNVQSWSAVKDGDAVISLSDTRSIDNRFGLVWVLNASSSKVAHMSYEEKQRIWQRAGLHSGVTLESERLYRVSVVNLEPVEIQRVDAQGREFGGSRAGSESRNWRVEESREGSESRSNEREINREVSEARSNWRSNSGVLQERLGTEEGVVERRVGSNPMSTWRAQSGAQQASEDVGQSIGRWPEDIVLRRVVRTAVQALYALGLDIGEAEVALGGDGRTAVHAVWPKLRDTKLQAVALRRFAAWYAAVRAEGAERRPLLIGADPEFVLVTPSGKIASASRFFGAGVGGAAGADAMLVGRRLLYPVAELRPDPAADPASLAANIRRLMLRAADRISDPALRWAAGAMPVPGLALGGHIHLSGAPLTGRLLSLLDSYAAFPLALVEDPAGRARRPRYGTLGDYRLQSHGGFEYRTLPSWLVSPAAAKASFALALLCAREAFNLTYIPALEERYVEAYYTGDRTELADCLDGIAASIAATASFKELAPYIEPLFDAALRGNTWNESTDIRAKWRIAPY